MGRSPVTGPPNANLAAPGAAARMQLKYAAVLAVPRGLGVRGNR
jgi:hypothetical protein